MQESPYKHTELIHALRTVESDVATFFAELSDDEFGLRVDQAWTPAEHLDHLNIAVSAVARGLAVPRWLLRLRFGRVRHPSRRYEQLREDYRARLASGGSASGRYIPAQQALSIEQRQQRRIHLLARWRRVNVRLRAALEEWSENQLDRIRLPHPLLGKITTREMVFFTIYHGLHHIDGAKRRLPRFSSSSL